MLVMTLLICGSVLLVAIAALFISQVLNNRSNFQHDNAALAAVIANNSARTIAFKDKATATAVVDSLKAKPTVLSASLVLPNGTVLAHFGSTETAQTLAQFPAPGESRFTGGTLLITAPVLQDREWVGTLYLRTDYQSSFVELIWFYGQVIFCVTAVSVGLAVLMSGQLGRKITDPVLQLAATAKMVGEKNDYSTRALVSSGSDELGRLAESFNEMLRRIQEQDAALSLSQKKMEALIHAIDGIVWEREPNTFQFTFISRQSENILGYAPQAWLDEKSFWEHKLHPQDAAKAVQTAHEMALRGEPYDFEYRMVAADGHTVWIRESGMVLVENGRPMTMRGIFHDITQNKLDAEQLDQLNRRLIDSSRSAGMAEVATGVLHNVGNVLNSVSVSATVVADQLRRSKVDKLSRVAAMMREKNGHLAEFLTVDPKGKLIPEFISSVSAEMRDDRFLMLAKMETLGEHIEHIKEIVSMQQNYAKVSGVYEDLAAAALVEDALRINTTAFDRHDIELIREFDANTPLIRVDRHKVLQIVINLLRNAKHAIEAHNGGTRRLVIRIGRTGDLVSITVADTGVGIPSENLTKIFNQGFTTKKDGHGFGLHSSANAAKEMGGSLIARSNGLGQGAEFTLELPVATARFHSESVPEES